MSVVLPAFTLALPGTSWVGGRLSADWVPRFDHDIRLQPEAKGPIRIYNFGKGGATSADILADAPRLASLRPNHIFADCGLVNSCADGGGGPARTRSQTTADIQAMLAIWRGIPNVDITLCTMHSISATSATIHPAYENYVEDLRVIALAEGVEVLDTHALWPNPLAATLTYGAAPFAIAPTATFAAMADGTAWNPADKTAGIVMNGDNLGFTTITAATVQSLRGAVALAGKQHFEVVPGSAGASTSIGIADGAQALGAVLGGSAHSIAVTANGSIFFNGGLVAGAGFSFVGSDTIGVEVDRPNNLIYFMKGAIRSAGIDISGIAGAIYPAMSLQAMSAVSSSRFTPSGDGLHAIGPGAVDVYHGPAVQTWCRGKMANFWA